MADKVDEIILKIDEYVMGVFPEEYLNNFVYNDGLWPSDVYTMIFMEAIWRTYNKIEEKHSLRYFLSNNEKEDVSIRMRYSRFFGYSDKYRRMVYSRMDADACKFLTEIDPVISKNMSNISQKLDGYKLTKMNFHEINELLDKEIFRAILDGKLFDRHNVSKTRFCQMLDEYDTVIEELKSQFINGSDEEVIWSSLRAFILEEHYPIHFLYSVACCMEEENVTIIDEAKKKLQLFTALIDERSVLGYVFGTNSRWIPVRERFVNSIVKKDFYEIYGNLESVKEGLGIVSSIIGGVNRGEEPFMEWFEKNTTREDWAAFLRDYNIFEYICSGKKEWTKSRIENFRKCYESIIVKKRV